MDDQAPETEETASVTGELLAERIVRLVGQTLREHAVLVVPALALVSLSLKVIAVSNADITTSIAVLRSVGSIDLALALLITSLPTLVGLAAVVVVVGIPATALRDGDSLAAPLVVTGGYFVLLSVLVPWPIALAYGAAFGLMLAFSLAQRAAHHVLRTRSLRGLP